MNVSGFRENKNAPGYPITNQYDFNPIMQAFYALPIIAPTYKGLPQGYMNGSYTQQPVAAVEQSGYIRDTRWQFEGNAKLEYDFGSIEALQGLKAGVFVAYDYSNSTNRNFNRSFNLMSFSSSTFESTQVTASGINLLSSFSKSASWGDSFTVRPTITYEREFGGKHNVSALFLYEQKKGYSDTMTGRKNGYYADYPVDLSLGSTWEGIDVPVSGSFSDTGIASFAGRISYAYDRKYLAEFTFRADGSYKFAPHNRWGFFPSVALGWVVSEENFFKKALPKVDFLKLRASYGELGADDTSAWLYMQSYSTTAPSFSYIVGGTGHTAYYTSNYVYDNLTWSRTHSFNVGFDLSVWEGKLGVEFDWFYKLTDHILEQVAGSYAPSLGGNVPSYMNSGKMDNRGFELVLKHNNHFSSGWRYSLTGSLSWARNKVLAKHISDDHPMYRAILGQPIGSVYGFKATGLFQTEEQIANAPTAPSGEKRLGDLMYADINGDGKIDSSKDFVKIGRSYTPEMNFSLNMEVAYKNLYLTALWQGAALCSYQLSAAYNSGTFDNTMYTRPFYSSGNAPYYLVEGAWREDNRDAEYPRLSTVANGNNAWPSSWWVKNGAYLRLKNLQIGYTLPQHLLNKTGIERVNIYIAGTNLLTFSAFKYVDPEMPFGEQRLLSAAAHLQHRRQSFLLNRKSYEYHEKNDIDNGSGRRLMRHVLLRRHRPEPGRPLLSGHGLVLDDDRGQLCARTLFDLQLQLRILRHGIAQPDGCLFGHTEERFVGPVQPQLQPLAVPGIGVQQHQRRSVRVLEHPLRTYPPRKRVPARRPEIPGEVRREMDGHPHRRGAFLPRLRLLPALPRLWRGDSPHGGRWPPSRTTRHARPKPTAGISSSRS